MISSFKDLIVWQKSYGLIKEVYLLSADLPDQERFGLLSQMRRAVISIPSNIAEGSERGSRKEYAHFLRIALGSSVELETQLLIAKDVYNIVTKDAEADLFEVQKMLTAMIKKLELKPRS